MKRRAEHFHKFLRNLAEVLLALCLSASPNLKICEPDREGAERKKTIYNVNRATTAATPSNLKGRPMTKVSAYKAALVPFMDC